MEFKKLLYSVEDNLAEIRLNSPSNHNALSLESWRELASAFSLAQRDDNVTAILLSAEGKSFSSGFDMDDSLGMKEQSQFDQWKLLQSEKDHARIIWETKKPIVASVQGYCLGSGFELSLLADIVVASDDAKFGETELRFSTIPQPTLLLMIGIRHAKEFLMLADRIPANEAYRMGIVNRITSRDELYEESKRIAQNLANMPTETMQLTKYFINKIIDSQGFVSFTDWSFDLLHITKNMPTTIGEEFDKIAYEQGMKSALTWLNSRFS